MISDCASGLGESSNAITTSLSSAGLFEDVDGRTVNIPALLLDYNRWVGSVDRAGTGCWIAMAWLGIKSTIE